MKPFSGYEAKKKAVREILPAGGYVVKVLDVKEQNYTWGNVLEVSFDIIEGPHAGFFASDYKNNINEDKKWRGKYRLNEPKEDGTKEDGWTINTFNGAMYAFEDSNGGFHWDWDEKKLKGLTVGALFRRKEWKYNGQTGWTTECCELIPAQDVRENNFQIPKDKPLKNKSTARSAMPAGFEEIVDDDDDPPFKL